MPDLATDKSTGEPTIVQLQRSHLGRVVHWLDRLGLFRASLASFALTLAAALFLTYVVRPILGREAPLGGEGYDGYIELARNLVQGDGYVFEPGGHKVFHRPPLYPALLVPGMLLPESLWRIYVAILNSALFAAAAALVFKLADALLARRSVSWIAWLIFATNPFMIWAAKNAVSPICQTLAYLLMLYCAWRLSNSIAKNGSPPPGLLLASIGSFFAGMMVHGTLLLAAALLLLALAIQAAARAHWNAISKLALVGTALALLVAPWTWRNYRVTGMFIPIAGNSGLAYFAGNAHWALGGPSLLPHETWHTDELRHMGMPTNNPPDIIQFYGFTHSKWERLANEQMKQDIRAKPAQFGKKLFLNAIEYYFPIIWLAFPPEGSWATLLPFPERLINRNANPDIVPLTLYNAALVALSAAGIAFLLRHRRTRPTGLLLLAAWALFALPYFPFLTFVGHGMYNFGTMPALAIGSAIFILRRELNCDPTRF